MQNHVIFFEAEGGSDKWLDGHRKDTMPMVNAIRAKGWTAEVLKFRDEWKDQIFEYAKDKAVAFVSRINPGNLPNGEKIYFDTLKKLANEGLIGFEHPDVMQDLGAKDALTKITDTGLVTEDTYAYYTIEKFKEVFPRSISFGERVLKQNRGSTGSGIWRVQIVDERPYKAGDTLPLDTKLKLTEAVDNHVEHRTLEDFMTFAEQYIVGDNGMLVDMRFMPRIKEGEIRILMVGATPIFVVHKKPAEGADAFSATLFSGAKYTYDKPDSWKELVDMFLGKLPDVLSRLGEHEAPLIWTADFMLDWDENGNDTYVLGEINNSCVGFTSHLDQGIQDTIADRILEVVKLKSGK